MIQVPTLVADSFKMLLLLFSRMEKHRALLFFFLRTEVVKKGSMIQVPTLVADSFKMLLLLFSPEIVLMRHHECAARLVKMLLPFLLLFLVIVSLIVNDDFIFISHTACVCASYP